MTQNPRATAADGFAPRLALFYAGVFAAAGVQMPFFPTWLSAKGLDAAAIGLVLAAPMVARVLAVPVTTRIADRLGMLRGLLIATALATALGYALVGLATGFGAIFAAVVVASIAFTPTMPLADAYALRGLRLRGRAYGPVRLWGSVAYVAANLCGGLLLDRIERVDLIWLIVAGFTVMAATAVALAPLRPDAAPPIEPAAQKSRSYHLPAFLAVTAAASLVQASHAVYYGFSTLAWTAQGLDGTAIGALWALGVVPEIALFAVSARLPGALGPAGLLGLGAIGAAIRWTAMALDPATVLLPVLQCLHGLSFGATHLGAVQFLARAAPDRHGATAQGDFATILGVVTAAAMGLSGALYGAFEVHAYAAMALLAAAGGGFAVVANRLGRGD